jgi:hypothetical protein
MSEHDIAAQLDASLSAVHVAFARIKQAVVHDDTLSALEGMADAILLVAKFADAARAEVAKLRVWMPRWRPGANDYSSPILMALDIPDSGNRLEVWCYDGQWCWAFADGCKQPATSRDAAMRAAEAAAGLPQCEVIE